MKKRIIAIALVATMVVANFTGCGKQKENGNKEITVSYEHFNKTGYPVVDEPVTLTVMAPVSGARSSGLNNNKAILEWEKITGVDLEFIEVPEGEWAEELSITLASGDLPDIIVGKMSSSDLMNNMLVGNIIDLKPYIDAYGENIKAYMEKVNNMKEAITLPTGEIASLPYINMMTEEGKCPQSMLYVYQPWMDKLGLKTPTTAEELYDVLLAFKTKDPNGNGKADEIPFLPRYLDNFYELFSMFGITVQLNNYFMEMDGEIVFTPYTQNFREGLTYLKKLYQEGLVNPKVFTDGASQTLAKGSGAEVLAGSTLSAAAFATVGEERQEEMTLVKNIAAEGYEMTWINRAIVGTGRFVITKDCEYPDVAIRVWDYLFSDDGARLYWMGPEENYTWNEDRTAWTWNLAEGQTLEELRATSTIQTTCPMAGGFCQDWFKQQAGSETKANQDRLILGTECAEQLRRPLPEGLQYEKEVAEERVIYVTDLNSYVTTSMAQFITGKMDIERDWDTFIKQCDALLVDTIIEMTQEAYDTQYKAK